ncbi:MAG: translocation/assembly module TamB domain-containing protein [Rhodobacteraceae bacterium]|nr:translocation/assembly module TamB domain-containing protein [Paracoccaceae bacterium]
MKRYISYALAGVLLTSGASASEDEPGGLLVGFLEDTLSDETRQIDVQGLDGAFSSRATIQRLTASDEDGVWLTIENAVLDWNRLALLQGRFSVNSLSAERIAIARTPKAAPVDPELPTPEATPFALPDLPVAIELGEIRADTLQLGAALAGFDAELSVLGALQLADGSLDTDLKIERLDRPGDVLSLDADFAADTSLITLDATLREADGGLLSTTLGIPGAPELLFRASGTGAVTDFTADIALETGSQPRIDGQVVLQARPGADPETPGDLDFLADLSGDLTPLLNSDFHPFFGPRSALALRGTRTTDGALSVSDFSIRAAALDLAGALALSADGVLETAQLKGRVFPPLGADRIRLPASGDATYISGAELSLVKAPDDRLELRTTLQNLSRSDLSLEHLRLSSNGTLKQAQGLQIDSRIDANAQGIRFADEALNDAVGEQIHFSGRVQTHGDGQTHLKNAALRGADYLASGNVTVDGLESGFELTGDLSVLAEDLARFSGLAGRDISGRVEGRAAGTAVPLAGMFDVELDILSNDLKTGISQVDGLIAGRGTFELDAQRNEDGLAIRQLLLDMAGLDAQAKGDLNSRNGQLSFSARLADVNQIVPQLDGALSLGGDLNRKGNQFSGEVRLEGPNASYADLKGAVDLNGEADLEFDAVLGQLERVFPELAGRLAATGKASRQQGIWQIDGSAEGPAGIKARVAGTWDEARGTADMNADGQLSLEAANPFITPNSLRGMANFDLSLNGEPSVQALRGTITTNGATLAVPAALQALENLNTRITLASGRAQVRVDTTPSNGGRISVNGPMSLSAPFEAALDTTLSDVVLTDSLTYYSTASGRLIYRGALAGDAALSGRIDFGETEINLANASGSVSSAPIPEIRHVGASGAVQRTRNYAGLVETEKSGGSTRLGLDLVLSAPNRIFARGRGLQAELGGEILVRGTADNLAPSGQIELIRGTFDILGRRLNLTKGQVTLQGDLTPYVDFQSTSNTSEGTATMEISGPLDRPEVKVFSDPSRPSEEALALLLFGNNFEDLSPVALAQLAASVARLSGRGGGAQNNLRKGLGADTVDIGSDTDGATRFGAGAYLSDNVYTDLSINTRGETELNLNLDVTDNLTVKGSVDNAGSTGLGLFFERDY